MDLITLLTPAVVSVGTFVTLLFFLSIVIKRNDIADVAWGPGIAIAAWSTFIMAGTIASLPVLVVLGVITIWALRLGWRIGLKNLRKGAEDPRYKRWRDSWGRVFYIRSYLQVYLLQGALMIALGSSAIALSTSINQVVSIPVILTGLIIWLLGFYFEVVGDAQLDRFLKNPENKGKLMRYGLWKYSRHPNYFGEITMWWAIAFICIFSGASLWALISPITITILILFVSGIPLLEAAFKNHPEWAEYERTTSVLIPWWPKK